MSKQTGPYTSDGTTIRALARAIGSLVQTDGDHNTSIPALTLHRRSGPTEPLHCIYNLGLGVVAQGDKQVLLGEESIDYGPGQSMLTTIDLPVVSHVTRASGAEPFLGMMLTLDVRSIVQMASEMDEPRPRREDASRSISFEVLDADLLDALVRLVKLLGQPALVPGLAPLIQQEVILRLLTGPHGPQLRRLVTRRVPESADREGRRVAQAELRSGAARRRLGGSRAHEPLDLPAAFPRPDWREPVAVPEAIASAGSTAVDAERKPRRGQCRRASGVRKPVAIQSRVQSTVWRAASARCHAHAARSRYRRRELTSNGREVRSSWSQLRHRSTRPSLGSR